MSDLRDFLNWFDGFAENIEKTPSPKQWGKIKERVAALREVQPSASPKPVPFKPVAPPKPAHKFIIDTDGYARRTSNNKRVSPSEVDDIIGDLRGFDGDMKTIRWADESMGLNGHDLTIVGA